MLTFSESIEINANNFTDSSRNVGRRFSAIQENTKYFTLSIRVPTYLSCNNTRIVVIYDIYDT